ncbi:short-chain dehydrogenase reductase 3b [Citrus sinensis]|uniref:Short-chain dehydrogenase reductase 3b n=1 Tax=Citrus sinensis TaxID=2711 RepID=A0ACB8NMW1_CITSI|nr:short-chain dehydrogenase reductase 3b [Citrus sinensis]
MADSSMCNAKNKLEGKVAIITGGASGIGETTARLFADHGARMIVIADIQDELGRQVATSIGVAFDRLFAINVRGMAACVKHAARVMVEGGVRGSIVCTASVAGSCGGKRRTDYHMSKHAVIGLVRSASVQLGVHGIRVNCVSPHGLATPLTCHAYGMPADEVEKLFEPQTPLEGVVLRAGHVADAVLFLACRDSEFVTGHDLVVDGGFLIR